MGYLVNLYPQPSQTFIRREIAALLARGVEVHRFALRINDGELVDARDREERQRTRAVVDAGVLGLASAVARRALSSPAACWRAFLTAIRLGRRSIRGPLLHLVYLAEACLLVEWLAQARIEHLHTHFGTNSAAVAMMARILGGPPYSLTIHGPVEFDEPEGLRLGDKVALSAFTAAISEFGRSQLCRWSDPMHWEKLCIVRCGVDERFLEGSPVPVPAAPNLVSVARLSPEKGQLVLVDALGVLSDEGLEFSLTLIGDGPFRPVLERRIAERGLQDRIALVGWKDGSEVRKAMLESRALVVPSFAEGLPVVIMEALALHRPVVATSIAGIPELVVPGETGWLVPAGSLHALTDAIREVLRADADTLARLGAQGAARVADRHDATTEAERLLRHILASWRETDR